jgi:Phage integrase, N-terminal SAM-like domain
VKSYTEAVGLLAGFLEGRGHPPTVNAVKRADVRDFIADQLERWKPATAVNRYRSLQAFFKWCVAEGELKTSPMVGMRPLAGRLPGRRTLTLMGLVWWVERRRCGSGGVGDAAQPGQRQLEPWCPWPAGGQVQRASVG